MPQPVLDPHLPSSLLPGLPPGAKVLVIRLRSIGDVVLTLPALSALHAWRPDLRLSLLLESSCVTLVEGNPSVSEVLVRRGFLPTVRELRRRRFSMVFNMHGGPASAVLTGFSGAPVRVCWADRQFSFFYNVQVPLPAATGGRFRMHTAEHRLQQLFWAGLPAGPAPPAVLYPQPDALTAMQLRLAEKGISRGERYAVLRPGGAVPNKRWPVESFAQLARWLREEHGLVPIVNLGPGDEGIAAAVEQHLAPVSVVVAALNLRQLIALMAGADLLVGNDTGPTHIAAALGKPCVVIFGASDSAVWRPWQTRHRVVENPFPCERCPAGRCATFRESRCILTVTVDQVRQACQELLAENEKSQSAGAGERRPG
jgi:ADP-heptose:LPS heptosyltransferase